MILKPTGIITIATSFEIHTKWIVLILSLTHPSFMPFFFLSVSTYFEATIFRVSTRRTTRCFSLFEQQQTRFSLGGEGRECEKKEEKERKSIKDGYLWHEGSYQGYFEVIFTKVVAKQIAVSHCFFYE